MKRKPSVLGSTVRRGLESPALNVALFAFLLNFPWELWQVPFYQEMESAPHWPGIRTCTLHALGDAALAVIAYGLVAARRGSSGWVTRPRASDVLAFTAFGLGATVVIEWLSTGPLARWAYGSRMPTVPPLSTGLLPLLQWSLLSPLVVWFARRQLAGARQLAGPHAASKAPRPG